MTQEPSDLKPCPFCGGGEICSEGKYLPPTMKGPGSLISWEIHHWCEKKPGVVAQSITIRGREGSDAVAAWNTRHTSPELRKLVEAAEDFRQQVLAVHGPTHRVSFSALDAALEPFQKEE